MHLNIVPSNFTATTFKNCSYDQVQDMPDGSKQKTGQVSLQKPISVLFEGVDTDVYKPDGTILLRFRKSVIPKDISQMAMNSLRQISMKKHDNRGAPAGPLDWNKMPNYVGDWFLVCNLYS